MTSLLKRRYQGLEASWAECHQLSELSCSNEFTEHTNKISHYEKHFLILEYAIPLSFMSSHNLLQI